MYSKNDFRYWEQRVFFPPYTDGGVSKQVKDVYSVRIQFAGRREVFSTGSSSKREAGKEAVRIYHSLNAVGWAKTRQRFKPKKEEIHSAKNSDLTIGEYFLEVEKWSTLRPRTLATYTRKFRKIVADIEKISSPDDHSKFDYVNGGCERWKEKIDKVRLSRITPEKVEKWKIAFIRAAGSNHRDEIKARASANTFIRNSRALFSRKLLKNLSHLELPRPLPFDGVELEKTPVRRYQSEIEPQELLTKGYVELAEAKPEDQEVTFKKKPIPHDTERIQKIAAAKAESKHEAFKILVLGLCAGLRRDEIDKLQWDNVLWTESAIRIRESEVFSPKHGSRGDIPIDAEILEFLKLWKSTSTNTFVVNGVPPRPDATYEHYRANKHQKTLIAWLREKGINSSSPIHALRKEFGSLICQKAGIYVASRMLRHSDIQLTAKHYTDDRDAVTTGLGKFFS